jgi:hypothetical protein
LYRSHAANGRLHKIVVPADAGLASVPPRSDNAGATGYLPTPLIGFGRIRQRQRTGRRIHALKGPDAATPNFVETSTGMASV